MISFSQFGEDKFLLDIFNKKKIENGFFIEFGAWDGVHLSNCKVFANLNWSGCFIEGNYKKYLLCKKNYEANNKISVVNKYIDKDFTLNDLISENHIKQIDILSIDIDGKDLTELKRLNLLKPRTIIIEFNGSIPLDVECEDTLGGNGSSYLSIHNHLVDKNYELIFATLTNLIFIDKDFNQGEFKTIGVEEIMKVLNPLRFGFNNYGEMFFIENKKIVKKEYYKFPNMKDFITFQPVPVFIRRLTDENGRGYKYIKVIYSHLILLFLRPNLFFKKIFLRFRNK